MNDIPDSNVNIEELEAKIEKSKAYWWGVFPSGFAIIDGEYSVKVRNKIARRYTKRCWKYVYHRTSSENGETMGSTTFRFSNEEIVPQYVKNCHMVRKE